MSWSLDTTMLVSLSHNIANFAVNWLIQSTVLILIGLITARLLIRRGSAVQFVLHSTTLAAIMICPVVTWSLSSAGITHWSVVSFYPQVTAVASLPDQSPVDEQIATRSFPPVVNPSMRLNREPDPSAAERRSVDTANLETTTTTATSEMPGGASTNAAAGNRVQWFSLSAISNSLASILSLLRSDLVVVAGTLIWIALSSWFLARIAIAWSRLSRICGCALPAEGQTIQICEEISRKMCVHVPEVLYTPFLPSPCLAGVIKPVILLPETDLTSSMQNVLVHELAHLRRRDYFWQLFRTVATSLFWFQPLLWLLSYQMEMAAEEVCDDFVVEFGADRARYAHCLIDVAEFSTAPMALAGVAMVSFQSMLTHRVKRIMDTTRLISTRTSRRLITSTFVAGSVSTLIIGLLGVTPPTSAKSPFTKLVGITPSSDVDAGGESIVIASKTKTTEADPGVASDKLVALAPTFTPEQPQKISTGSLPGILSSPPLLAGGRRWQMYTKNASSGVTSVCWSPDGRWLALANGSFVRLFDFQDATPELKVILAGHSDSVKSVRFNAQGTRLATAANDGTVRIWDIDGREQYVYRDHEDAVLDVSWHPDGMQLASGSLDGTVRVWTTGGKTLAVLREHEAPVNAVAWDPSGKRLASGCENRAIRFWNELGQPGPVIESQHVGPVKSLAWNFDGSRLLSCDFGIESTDWNDSNRAHIKVWDAEANLISEIAVERPLSHITWNPAGTQAVAGSWRSIVVWKVGDRQVKSHANAGWTGVVPVAWRPTGESIAAGALQMTSAGAPAPSMTLRNASLASIALNPDQSVLGIGRFNGGFDLYSSDGEERAHPPATGFNGQVQGINWSPDGQSMIPAIRYQSRIQRYDTKGVPIGTVIELPGDTRGLDWSRDGKLVAAGGDQFIVTLTNMETGKVTQIGRHTHGITRVRFTPDQQQICSAGYDNCIRFWSLDGKPLKVLETISAPIDALAWSGDGQLMATGHQDQMIRLWNGEGEMIKMLGGHGGYVEALEFNPAGTFLASGSRDNSVRLWKRDGTHVATLRGHLGAVFGLSWTGDGRKIYSCSEDGTIRLWNIETGMSEWQVLLGDTTGYVTVDAQGRIKHGDEKILESDFVFFAEDNERRLTRSSLSEIRAAISAEISATGN